VFVKYNKQTREQSNSETEQVQISVQTDKMTHAVTCIIEESWTVYLKKFGSAEKLAVNMSKYVVNSRNSAEKLRLAEIWAVFFPSQPNFLKKIGIGVLYHTLNITVKFKSLHYITE